MDPVCKSPCNNACVCSQNLHSNNHCIQIRRNTPRACVKNMAKTRNGRNGKLWVIYDFRTGGSSYFDFRPAITSFIAESSRKAWASASR